MRAARSLVFWIVLLAIAVMPTFALAQAPPAPDKAAQLAQRQAAYTWEKQDKGPDLLLASFSFVDVVDSAIRQKLSSGLQSVIVMRAYVLREGEASHARFSLDGFPGALARLEGECLRARLGPP